MKIVDRQTFLAMPKGIVFSKYKPHYFGDLSIKGETCGKNDFFVQGISGSFEWNDTDEFVSKLEDAKINKTSLAVDFNVECRDGLFEDDQLFAVMEEQDVRALIHRLEETLKGNR